MAYVLLFLFEGLLMMALSRPMIKRRIGPNRFYGFRTPKTLSSPDIWYPANEFSGRRLFAAGVLITICSLLLAPLNLLGTGGFIAYTWLMAGVMVISLLGAVVASFQYLKRL